MTKIVFAFLGMVLVATGCSPTMVELPFASSGRWAQSLTSDTANGVAVVSLVW